MDGCRSQKQSARERAGTSTLTGCQLKMPESAIQPLVCLSLLPRERYYLWIPELFMHCKITPWVGQNETCAGDCDGDRIIFITSAEAWAVACKESNRKWDEHCQWFTLVCFNMLFFDSGHCRLQHCSYTAMSSYINANKFILLYWFLENHSPWFAHLSREARPGSAADSSCIASLPS